MLSVSISVITKAMLTKTKTTQKLLKSVFVIAIVLVFGLILISSEKAEAAKLLQTEKVGCDAGDLEVRPPYIKDGTKYYCVKNLQAGEWTSGCKEDIPAAQSPFGPACLTVPDKYTFDDSGAKKVEKIKRNTEADSSDCSDDGNPSTLCGLFENYISPAVKFLSVGVGVVVTIMIIIGGIQYSTAGGDPQATAAAKKKISNAILALVAYSLIFALLEFIVPGGGVFK